MSNQPKTLDDYLRPVDAPIAKPSDFVSNELIDRNYDYPAGKINYTHITPASRIYSAIVSLSGEVGTFKSIQLAINYVSRIGGGAVFIKNGQYIQTEDISIPSGVSLVGESGEAVIDFDGEDFQINSIGELIYKTGSITVTNNSTTVTGSGTIWDSSLEGSSILIRGAFYLIHQVVSGTQLILDNSFSGDSAAGLTYIIANPNTNVTINNLTIQNSTHPDGAIFFEYSLVMNLNVVTVVGSTLGLNIQNSDTTNMNNFSVLFCDYGIVFNNSANCSIYLLYVANILVGDALNANAVNAFSIVNWGLFNAAGRGMYLSNSYNYGLIDFSIISNTGIGVQLDGSRDGQIISGDFLNNTTDGLALITGNSRNIINNLSIRNNGGFGVNISSANNINNLVIGNIFSSNTNGAVSDSGTGTLIRSNIGQSDN